MKRLHRFLAIIILLAIPLTVLPVTPVHADISTTNLVGHWKLDGNATGTVGPNGTLTGGSWSAAHASTDFANTGSLSLNGTADQGIQIDPPVTSQITNISLVAWVNWSGSTGNPQMIVYNGNSGPCGYGILIYGGFLSVLNGGISILQSATSLSTGSWHQVVATRDATIWKLYLDGTEVTLPSPWSTPVPPVETLTCTNPMTSIGRGTVVTSNTFNGLIDDVRIYERVLTPADLGMPTVTAFTATSPSSTWNIPIPTFTATDDLAVTGYLITTSATPPAAGAAGWTATVPTSYTVAANGTYTLYPWVKDADGHVSGLYGSPASVVVDTTPLVVHFGEFSIPPSEGANLIIGPSQLVVRFSENVVSDGSPNAANSLWNYMLLRPGPNGVFDTPISTAPPGIDPICDSDHVSEGDDEKIDFSNATYNAATFAATLTIDPTFAPLANGTYRLYVCGAASINDLAGNPLNGGANTAINFTVSPAPVAPTAAPAATPLRAGRRVPNTGFAPGRVTLLAPQTASYADLGDLWLEVPKLGVKMSIVGVPKKDNEWDVSWLGRNAGWLEGSAFPSWNGNSVLTGHVWNADNSAGPFRYLNTLWWGDKVIVHLSGHKYIYEVRAVKQVASTNVSAMMKHEELPWLTLVTCKGYDEEKDEYRDRILVRAVLIEVK